VRIGRGALLAAQGVLSLYGGYFGGAVGIMIWRHGACSATPNCAG
jgi:hypothetical protein